MSVVIKNVHGQYWTGKCWGVRQAAEIYESIADLPEIDGFELVRGWMENEGDAWYYPEPRVDGNKEPVDNDDPAFASPERVR